MATPVVAGTNPLNGATDVAVDITITFTFNTPLLRTTVNNGTVLLYRDDTGEAIDARVSLSTDGTVIILLPRRGLLEDVSYVAAVAGSADNMPAGNIKAADGSDLINTYDIAFRIRVERFVSLPESTSRTDIERVGPIREEDAAAQVTGYLNILNTHPKGFASDVDRSISEIVVYFGSSVAHTGSYSALELTMRNVLGLDEYYGEQGANGVSGCRKKNRFLKDWLEDADEDCINLFAAEPSGAVAFSGSTVKWTKATGSPDFHYNTEVIVRVRADSIVNPTGHMLPEDVYFTFTTEYFPLYVGVEYIRLKLGRAVSDLFDDTIRRHIHASSIDAVDHAARKFDVEHPYPAVRRYVRSTTILNILDELGVLVALQSGRKTLGDLTIQYNPADIAKIMSAYKSADKEQKKALAELRAYRRQSRPRAVVKGVDNIYERQDYRMRTWQHLRNTQQIDANTASLRRAKSNLAHDHPSVVNSIAYVGYVSAEEQSTGVAFPWW